LQNSPILIKLNVVEVVFVKEVITLRILLAEDETSLSRALVKILEKNNYTAEAVDNGLDALDYLESGGYDAAILDVMMPRMDGISVLKALRQRGNTVPLIMLTAKAEIEDKVLGLDSGANDYLTKPFDTRELLARLRVITRKKEAQTAKLSFGNIMLDRSTFELSSPFGSFRLANKEYQMMEMLLCNPHQLISTERFMEKTWGFDSDSEINVVWVYISYLRKKLSALHANVQIKVTRNAGYSLEENP